MRYVKPFLIGSITAAILSVSARLIHESSQSDSFSAA